MLTQILLYLSAYIAGAMMVILLDVHMVEAWKPIDETPRVILLAKVLFTLPFWLFVALLILKACGVGHD